MSREAWVTTSTRVPADCRRAGSDARARSRAAHEIISFGNGIDAHARRARCRRRNSANRVLRTGVDTHGVLRRGVVRRSTPEGCFRRSSAQFLSALGRGEDMTATHRRIRYYNEESPARRL